jgi:DNA-directed RNA polymerase subunit RPC12/RpoP
MKICDKCGQTLNPPRLQQAGKRVCAECGSRIRLHDKWSISVDGRLRHHDCKKPAGVPVEKNMELGL